MAYIKGADLAASDRRGGASQWSCADGLRQDCFKIKAVIVTVMRVLCKNVSPMDTVDLAPFCLFQ